MKRPWRAILQRAVEVLRTEGPMSLGARILGEVGYRRVVLIERDLSAPPARVEARIPLTIGPLRESEVEEYVAFRPGTDPAEVYRRLRDGHMCLVARHEGNIVHTCWVATGRARIEYLRRELSLPPDTAYVYEAFTAPEFRGQGISAARSLYLQEMLRRAGYRRAIAVIVPENRAAFRPPEKAGYRRAGVLRTLWFGPWRWHFGRIADPRPPSSDCPAYWDQVAREMKNRPHYLDPFLGRMKREAHLNLVRRWSGARARGRVLKTDLFEEALGPDAFLTDLDGRLVVGMDISPTLTREARGRDGEARARYLAADVRHLPFADGSFDLILSPSTLDHFTDPADLPRSLRELARVLAPDGALIVTLDNRQNIFDPVLRLAIRLGRVPYAIGRAYTVGELRAALTAAGLTVRETTAILHNPRLVATGAVALANRLGWPPLVRLVRRALTTAQRLEGTRWQYRTGSFVAALAVHPEDAERHHSRP